jgi:serine protease Do
MKTNRAFISGAFGSLAAWAILLALPQGGLLPISAAEKPSARTAPKIVLNTNALPKDTRGITSFAPVVKRVAPSVVTIYSSKVVRQDLQSNPFFNDPFFRRFFGGPDDEEETPPAPGPRGGRRMQPPSRQREQTQQSLGSGVIITADGYILSNNHVVEGADEVKVALSESEDEYVAKVIGTDPQTDISVLKIDAKNLSPITITDSDYLQVGDVVLAVGNPFGVGQTVTMGIVSATGRGKFGIVDYEDFIQTDAAVNRGNSGGALVDAEGRLVGINTAIISPTGGSIGIGFAVPVNMARRVMDSIVQNGKVTRGYLGVYIQDVTPQLAKQFNLKDRSGALVGGVPDGTPAAKAGLQPGDVITEFNGRKVPDSRQLRLWVSQTPPNTKTTFKLLREGRERTVNMTLGELPTEMAGGPPGRRPSPTTPKSDALDGVEVSDLDQRTRRQMEIPSNVQGALVTAVDPNSTAADAGLKQGDVIVEINRRKVANAQEAIELSDKIKSDEQILLRVWSGGRGGGGTRYIVVEPEKPSKSRERNQE